MAYKNLVDAVASDKAEAFCHIRDFLCKRNGTYDYSTTGIGWTLVDSSYAVDEDSPQLNDWFVIYSAGESGDEDMYYQFVWTSGYFRVKGYQSWDATAHDGGNKYLDANNFTFLDAKTSAYISVYGDLDSVAVIVLDSTDYDGCFFGLLEDAYDTLVNEVATCPSALTSGSDVSITVDAVPSSWEVGREIFIRTTHTNNSATVEVEKTTIKTLVGNTITADLSNSYTANSKLSVVIPYYASNTNQPLTSCAFLIGGPGTVGTSTTGYFIFLALSSSSVHPTEYENRHMLAPLFCYGANQAIGHPAGWVKNIMMLQGFYDSLVMGDTVTDVDGNVWRCRKVYSNKYVAFLEV